MQIPLTWDWWQKYKDKGLRYYYKIFYKPYYATYFDIRDMAKGREKQLFQTKIVKAGDILVIDTVAANYTKIIGRLNETKKADFHNTVVYLEIDPSLAIERDKWRQEHEGRGVGAPIIQAYSHQMDSAYSAYDKEGSDPDGVVDRLMHFVWKPAGDSPIKGDWVLIEDKKYFLKRKLKK